MFASLQWTSSVACSQWLQKPDQAIAQHSVFLITSMKHISVTGRVGHDVKALIACTTDFNMICDYDFYGIK